LAIALLIGAAALTVSVRPTRAQKRNPASAGDPEGVDEAAAH
jgi:hypothetical protein